MVGDGDGDRLNVPELSSQTVLSDGVCKAEVELFIAFEV